MSEVPPELEKIFFCNRCGYCHAVCPTYRITKFDESEVARGRLQILKRVITKWDEIKKDINADFIAHFYHCLLCGACVLNCPAGIDVPEIVIAGRKWITDKGFIPPKELNDATMKISKFNNIFGAPQSKRPKPLFTSDNPEVLFFAGCVASFKAPELVKSYLSTLKKAVDICFLGDKEPCCGIIARRTGFDGVFRSALNSVNNAISEVKVEKIISPCPSCVMALREVKDNIEVKHTSEFISELISKGDLKLKKLKAKVAFHDPCQLARRLQVTEAPRKILSEIEGLELIEFDSHGKNTVCCGSGSFLNYLFLTDRAIELSSERLKEAKDKGVNIVVTACPSCYIALKEAEKAKRMGLKIMDISQILHKVT